MCDTLHAQLFVRRGDNCPDPVRHFLSGGTLNTHALFDLTGRVALVTGGNGGIGRGIAIGLADAGAAVAVFGRNEDKNGRILDDLKAIGRPSLVMNAQTRDRRTCAWTSARVLPWPELPPVHEVLGSPVTTLLGDVALCAPWSPQPPRGTGAQPPSAFPSGAEAYAVGPAAFGVRHYVQTSGDDLRRSGRCRRR